MKIFGNLPVFTGTQNRIQNKIADKPQSFSIKKLDCNVVSFSRKQPVNDTFALYLLEQELRAGKNGMLQKEA